MDGLYELERDAINELLDLGSVDITNMKAIVALAWFQDEITETEHDAIARLQAINRYYSKETTAKIIAMTWFQDGVTGAEYDAILNIRFLAREDVEAAEAVVAMPWVQDGITETESGILNWLFWLADENESFPATALASPWVQDGINETERNTLNWLFWLHNENEILPATVLALPWVQDGITGTESEFLNYLENIEDSSKKLAAAVITMPWVQDGISRDEATVIEYLYRTIRAEDESMQPEILEKVTEILAMPFLDTVESPDALAVRSLERFENAGSAEFLELMIHPALSDGIDDEEAKIVALLGATNDYKPDSVQVLLNSLLTGAGVYKEERTITLPHSGEAPLAIIRLRDNTNASMDYLEHAVRNVEGFMGEPLPNNYIAYYFDDALPSHGGAVRFRTHIASLPAYDGGHYWYYTPPVMAHEVSHTYWRDGKYWLTEAAADFHEMLSEKARIGQPLNLSQPPCPFFSGLGELEVSSPEYDSDEGKGNCDGQIGEVFFLDLYHAMGEAAFQQAFRNLYLKRLYDDPADDCEGTYLGICHVEAAFKANVSGDMAARVDKVIDHWYYGRTASHEADRAELTAFYHATGGTGWTNSTNWLSDAHIEKWYGVTTDADGRVIALDLAQNGLSGSIPPGLGNLANLRVLSLNYNRLTGQIPPELGGLGKLTRLELGDNGLTGEIPSSLSNLTNLVWLELDDNDLTGAIPSSLGGLIHLTWLELYGNKFTGPIPSSMGNLSSLRHLWLVSGNQFTGCVPVGLTNVADNDVADSGLPSC